MIIVSLIELGLLIIVQGLDKATENFQCFSLDSTEFEYSQWCYVI